MTKTYEEIVCSVCGDPARLSCAGDVGDRMREKTLCFACAFWEEKVEWVTANPDVSARIHGRHYIIAPDLNPGRERWLAGFNGDHFLILFTDGRRVETRNLWNGGEIPERWRDQLPDNAEFGQ